MEILLISFIAGIVCFIALKKNAIAAGITAVFTSAACLYFSVKLFILKQIDYSLLPVPEVFRLDPLNLFIVPFICLFGFLIILYSLGFINRRLHSAGDYYAYLLWTICVSSAAVMANNIILFMAMWGIGAFLLYLLVGIYGGEDAAAAGKKTFILVGGSDVIMLLGAAILYHITGSFNMDGMRVDITGAASVAAFLCLVIGALTKAGAMPFHTWIPHSSTAAPATVMAVLPASLDKLLGIYLLAKCSLIIFIIEQNSFLSFLLMIIGAVTIICAVMMALVQHDMKKLLAYHAVSQVGYMVLGLGVATPLGIAGGIFHMLNHAIYKSCLFLTAGNVEHRTKDTNLDSLGGLAVFMPLTFICCLIASLSISGVPPFNGFFSKWMIYQALIQNLSLGEGRFITLLCLVSAMFGSALTLASFTKLLHAVFLGRPSYEIAAGNIKEVPWVMWLPAAVLSLLCVVFGVFANLVPLKYFIYPAVTGVSTIGAYAPVASAALIVIGVIAGFLIYYFSGIKKAARKDASFTGGEVMPAENRVSGSDFYKGIKEFEILKGIYDKAEAGMFDIYHQGKNIAFGMGKFFQYLHNGVLPTYMVWTLLGMIGLFFAFMK